MSKGNDTNIKKARRAITPERFTYYGKKQHDFDFIG